MRQKVKDVLIFTVSDMSDSWKAQGDAKTAFDHKEERGGSLKTLFQYISI